MKLRRAQFKKWRDKLLEKRPILKGERIVDGSGTFYYYKSQAYISSIIQKDTHPFKSQRSVKTSIKDPKRRTHFSQGWKTKSKLWL